MNNELKLQTHTQYMQYFLLLNDNNGFANAPECHVYTYVVFFSIWWKLY